MKITEISIPFGNVSVLVSDGSSEGTDFKVQFDPASGVFHGASTYVTRDQLQMLGTAFLRLAADKEDLI